MNETFPQNSHEHPTDAEIIAGLESKEVELQNEAVGLLENMGPEKFKSKAASVLLASVLAFNAFSAFAGEQGADKMALPDMGEESITQMAEKSGSKNSVAPFDWSKIAGKIELSAGVTAENVKNVKTESVDSRDWSAVSNSTFYSSFKGAYQKIEDPAHGVSYWTTPESQAEIGFYTAVNNSHSSQEFFSNFASQANKFGDEKQKVIALQKLGEYLGYAYNEEMINNNVHVAVSSDSVFQSMKEHLYGKKNGLDAGICGNIHTFLMQTAQSAGMEAFMQSGTSQGGGGHVWTGLVVDNGGKKEIVFLDYGTAIPTGTLNYKDALGVAERYHRSVSTFNNYVGDESGVLFPVESRASEVLKKSAGIEDPMLGLERNLQNGEMVNEGSKFEVRISPEITELKLGSNTIGLTFFNYKDAYDNSYQSLKEVNAWRGNIGIQGEKGSIGTSVTVVNMNIKDVDKRWGNTQQTAVDEITTSLSANYIDNKQFTKEEYGQFKMNWGATLSAAMNSPIGNREGSKSNNTGGEVLGAVGARLIFVDPSEVGKFYIDASQGHRLQTNDFEEQKAYIKEVSNKITLGGEVKVFEGKVLGLEIGGKKSDWGDTLNINAGLTSGDSKVNLSYEKSTSDNERFIPSSQKVEIEVAQQMSPTWEVDFIVSNKTEHYKDGTAANGGEHNILNVGVKAKMFLW